MQFFRTLNQLKARPELPLKGFSIVTHHFKTAALRGTLGSERTNDYVTSLLDRAGDLPDVGGTLAPCGEKVKNSTIVPHIISSRLQFDPSDVCDKPANTRRGITQSFPVCIYGCLRNIEDADVCVSPGEEVINQGGFSGADINNGRGRPCGGLLDKIQRGLKVRPVPANFVPRLLHIDFFPMTLCVHTYYRSL